MGALKAALGRFDLIEFVKVSKSAGPFSDLEKVVGRDPGKSGVMLYMELDHGAALRKETGLDKPKIVRLVVGNPLIMSYDRIASFLAPYGRRLRVRSHGSWMRRSKSCSVPSG